MQTEDVQLRQIQAGNQQVRKKLEVFRSGLERLMNKKQTKKLIMHQPPSQDNKYSNQKYKNQLDKQISQSPQSYGQNINKGEGEFGFNSTLFRQINDETLLSNNSSAINIINNKDIKKNFSCQNSYKNTNKNFDTNYFSTSTKKSEGYFLSDYNNNNYHQTKQQAEMLTFNNNRNQHLSQSSLQQQALSEPQSFKKSSLLFSQIDQLMNRVNKSSKLPIKPIQKYINFKQQSQLLSLSQSSNDFNINNILNHNLTQNNDSMKQIQLTLSNTNSNLISSDKKIKLTDREQKISNNSYNNKGKDRESIKNNQHNELLLRQNSSQDKQQAIKGKRSSSLLSEINMKQPPLPPSINSSKNIQFQNNHNQNTNRNPNTEIKNNEKTNNNKQAFILWGRELAQNKNILKKDMNKDSIKKQQTKDEQLFQLNKINKNGQQNKIVNKVKLTINERKKLLREEHLMMDESIELQLSSQQQQQGEQVERVRQQQDRGSSQSIDKLKEQKQQLLKQLQQIQQQLNELQTQQQHQF